MPALTPAQLAILKLVSSFDGKFGPCSIDAAMKAFSEIPESEWAPIHNQLNMLEDLGFIRPDVTETGLARYRMTHRGRNLVGGWASQVIEGSGGSALDEELITG
jgi:Fe2+ or Zn2+ uptake regulation protein